MNTLAIYVPHADANGNIVRYTDTAGNIVAEYTYDAFGKTIAQTGPLAEIFRIRFSSKYYDSETGLYYSPLRIYKKCINRKMKYLLKITVLNLDKHPKYSNTPEIHQREKEGKTFEYGPI